LCDDLANAAYPERRRAAAFSPYLALLPAGFT
jgi:hypothetical protein